MTTTPPPPTEVLARLCEATGADLLCRAMRAPEPTPTAIRQTLAYLRATLDGLEQELLSGRQHDLDWELEPDERKF